MSPPRAACFNVIRGIIASNSFHCVPLCPALFSVFPLAPSFQLRKTVN